MAVAVQACYGKTFSVSKIKPERACAQRTLPHSAPAPGIPCPSAEPIRERFLGSNHCLERWLPKCAHQQIDLAPERSCRNWHVDIGLTHIAVPFRNLVFENEMISKRIPGQASDLAMVLMRVVSPMREDHIGIDARASSASNHDLIASPCSGKKPSRKAITSICVLAAAARKSAADALASCSRSPAAAEHAPMNVEANAALDQAEKRRAGADLDIIRMGAQTQDGQPIAAARRSAAPS